MSQRSDHSRWTRVGAPLAIVLLAAGLAFLQLAGLSRPLLWNDEGETIMYATRVVEHGYPKVHGERNVVYELDVNIALGVNERLDAFIGSPWVQYYVGTVGVLLARPALDDYAKTARLRLPFALAGLASVLVALLAFVRLPLGTGWRRTGFALGYLLLACFSVSMLLHFREARYYSLVALELAALAHVHTSRRPSGGRSEAARVIAEAALLVALFHTFFPAFASAGLAIVISGVLGEREAARSEGRPLRVGAPLLSGAIAALVAFPGLLFYETLRISEALGEMFEPSLASMASNLGKSLFYLVRYEFLAPAILAGAARVLVARTWPDAASSSQARRAARFVWLLVALHVLITARVPWFFSRYVVVLSPLVTALALLEVALLASELRRTPIAVRRLAATAVALALAASLGVKLEDVAGRIDEIRLPYRGPLDYVVEHLRERYPDPEQLVIATNYESTPLMYYLGSHVIVGYSGASRREDMELEPDVLVPRRYWPRNLGLVDELRRRGEFAREVLPVDDLPVNNVPELVPRVDGIYIAGFRGPQTRIIRHHYRTSSSSDQRLSLEVYHRIPPRTVQER